MATADTAKLIASLELKDAFTKPLAGATRALAGFDAKLSQTQGRAFKAGQQIGTGIKNGAKIAAIGLGLISTQVLAGLRQLVQLESITAQTNAVLTSTKGIAGQTADSVRGLAEKFENLNATMDDKVIQSGENLLLTFTNIRKDAFEPALLAALDMNTALGKGPEGLTSTVTQIGKALNDPTKGLTALSRVGVTFTAQQKEQIKALQKSGDLLGAQKIILSELGTEFGGSFAAKGRTAEGTIAGIGDAVEDLQKGLATALFPTIQKLLPKVRELLTSPAFAKGASDLGDAIAGIFSEGNIKEGARVLEGAFKVAKDAAPAIQAAAEVTGRIVGTAVEMFKSLPPELQALAVGGLAINKLTGGLVTNIAGGLISAVLKQLVSGVVNVNGAVVNVAGVPGVGGGGKGIPPILPLGIGALLGPLGVGAALGIGSKLITDNANTDLRSRGIDANFKPPGGGVLPFGIENAIHNIGEAIKIANRPVPVAIKDAARADTRSSLQVEQAIARNAQRVAAASAAAARSMVGAVKEKDLSVGVNVVNRNVLMVNGRLFDASTNRYTSTIVGSRGAFREFG